MRYPNGLACSVLCLVIVCGSATLADDGLQEPAPSVFEPAQTEPSGATTTESGGRLTVTDGFWGLSDELARHGIEVAIGATNIYQANVRNGLGTHQKSGRLTGSYDLEIATDLEKLLGIPGVGLFVHGWGGWPASKGINETMVGSAFEVNWDAIGNRPLDVVEVIFEWSLFENHLAMQVGKINFAGVFDTSEYANDEASQFLNGAFINNLTIPIPDYCLGVTLTADLTDAWYVAAGMGDAEADGRETGFATTFDGDDFYFYCLETGIRAELDSARGPLLGNYRLGVWYDPQPKGHSDSEQEYRDDVGIYSSVDQMIFRESPDPEDGQGLGAFARYGYTDEKRNDLSSFWSVGMQYHGLLEGRDADVLAVGFAQGAFSNLASTTFTVDHESVIELYYLAQVTSWIAVSPDIQYVSHPGGVREVDDALVIGVRAQIEF